MKQRQGVYTYRRGDRVDCIDRSTKAGLEQTEAAEAVVYGNLYCKMDKGAAKQGRKYLILFEENTGLFFVSCPARWRRKGKAALGLLSDADLDNDEKVDHMTFEECQAMVDKFSGAAELQGIDTTKKPDSHVQKPPPSIQATRDRYAIAPRRRRRLARTPRRRR